RTIIVLLLALGAIGGLFMTNQGSASATQMADIAPAAGVETPAAANLTPVMFSTSAGPVSDDRREALIAGLTAGKAAGASFRDVVGMREFYEASGFTPLWLNRDGLPNNNAKTVLGSLETSWTHGLNPLTYHVEK